MADTAGLDAADELDAESSSGESCDDDGNNMLIGAQMEREMNRRVRAREREKQSVDVCANSCCNRKDARCSGPCVCSVGSRLLARFRAQRERGEGDLRLVAEGASAPVAAHRCVLFSRIRAKAVFCFRPI